MYKVDFRFTYRDTLYVPFFLLHGHFSGCQLMYACMRGHRNDTHDKLWGPFYQAQQGCKQHNSNNKNESKTKLFFPLSLWREERVWLSQLIAFAR